MINKRLLIRNILANHDEGTFFDKKLRINIGTKKEQAKFLKHVVALHNSNPNNNSYIISGVQDGSNNLIGHEFVDDSQIQNLINTYLNQPIFVRFENVFFPSVTEGKFIGLITISNSQTSTYFKKNIENIKAGDSYYRMGSTSVLAKDPIAVDSKNIELVNDLEKNSKISISDVIKDISNFFIDKSDGYNPQSIVFFDQSILCWSGWHDRFGDEITWSEIDIILVNESVRLFYSAISNADIKITDTSFSIIEKVNLGYDDKYSLYPFRKTVIEYYPNGKYTIKKINVIETPSFNLDEMKKLYIRAKRAAKLVIENKPKNQNETRGFSELIANYFYICYVNGIKQARQDLIESSEYLDGTASLWCKECLMLLEFYENGKKQLIKCNDASVRYLHLHIQEADNS